MVPDSQIQKLLNTVGQTILSVNKGVSQWLKVEESMRAHNEKNENNIDRKKRKQLYNPDKTLKPIIEEQPRNFFKSVYDNKEVSK